MIVDFLFIFTNVILYILKFYLIKMHQFWSANLESWLVWVDIWWLNKMALVRVKLSYHEVKTTQPGTNWELLIFVEKFAAFFEQKSESVVSHLQRERSRKPCFKMEPVLSYLFLLKTWMSQSRLIENISFSISFGQFLLF